jgi:hypothetical protein
MKNNWLVIAILMIVVGAAGFFGGMKYQQSRLTSRFAGGQMQTLRNRQGVPALGMRNGAGAVRGEIIDKDESSITVKLADGSSKLVLLSENTRINKAAEATTEDLKTGESVMVFGQTNDDGSVSATDVQLNPELRFNQP